MNTETDAAYAIGKSHLVCQDYAITRRVTAKSMKIPCAIIADGCSTSQNTDLGARIMAIAIVQAVEKCLEAKGSMPSHGDLAARTIATAAGIAAVMKLDPTTLDATVLLALAHGENIYVYPYGDGNIIHRDTEGNTTLIEIAYHGNMPFYLTYLLDRERLLAYINAQPACGITARQTKTTICGITKTAAAHYFKPTVYTFPMQQTSSVTLATDGLQSMQAEGLDPFAIAKELTDYKVVLGAFAQRRLRKYLSSKEKTGIFNTDDLALAAIAKKEEEVQLP